MIRHFDASGKLISSYARPIRTALIAFAAFAPISSLFIGSAALAQDIRIVRPPLGTDVHGDKIDARFEKTIALGNFRAMPGAVMQGMSAESLNKGIKSESTVIDAIVCLDHAPTASDISAIKSLGFTVKDVYSNAIYGIHIIGPVPDGVASIHRLVNGVSGLTYVSPNEKMYKYLIHSTRQIGARQSWTAFENYNNGLPLRGDPGRAIAVLDTGMDGTHTDLKSLDPNYATGNKIIAWYDSVSGSSAPFDPDGHGSHVSGIAAGTGVSGGISGGTGFIPITYSLDGFTDIPINVTGFTTSPNLLINGYFGTTLTDFSGATVNTFSLGNWTDNTNQSLATVSSKNGEQPISLSYTVPLTTTFPVQSGATVATSIPTNLNYYLYFNTNSIFGDPFDAIATVLTPQTATGDGYNLVTGVAPDSSLVGVRIVDDTAGSSDAAIIGGLDYVIGNQSRLNIGVVNISFGGFTVDPTMDAAVDNAVTDGIDVVVAAGNDRPVFEGDPNIAYAGGVGSPASASDAITVAAVGPQNEISFYSSYGSTTSETYSDLPNGIPSFTIPPQLKPDIAAPGGSNTMGADLVPTTGGVASHDESILSVDSNYSDNYDSGQVVSDLQSNDYTMEEGTSMSTPHVAGSVALVEQAMTLPGALQGTPKTGSDEAHFIKALLEMTSSGTNQNADAVPNPVNPHHAGRDLVEGYGKINTDAALSAILQTYVVGDTASATLGSDPMTTQVWARNVYLTAGTAYTFTETQPSTVGTVVPEYDLHLFPLTYTSNLSSGPSNGSDADPTELTASTSATGGNQSITYTPSSTGTYFIVVKRVVGTGAFTLTSTGGTVTTNQLATTVVNSSSNALIPNALVLAETSTGSVANNGITGTTGTSLGVATFTSTPTVSQVVVSAPGFFTQTVAVASKATAASVSLAAAPVLQPGLQMISLPGAATPIVGETFPSIFVDAIWTPGNQEYNLPPASIASNFAPGSAYWVRLRQPTTVRIRPVAVPAGTYNITLQAGWNMVGSPYINPSPLSAATITIGSVTESYTTAFANQQVSGFFSFNPATNFYATPVSSSSSILTPYVGYWVFAAQNETLTVTGQ